MLFDLISYGYVRARRTPMVSIGRHEAPDKPSRHGADGRRLSEAQYRRALRRKDVDDRLADKPPRRGDRLACRVTGYRPHRWKP